METELISVIVPVYKVEKYLDRCVQSIVNQTYPNLEIILVDDGSPDNSGNMCNDWTTKDKRIHVIHKKNGGLSDARNAGIEAATGAFISFVDSDDYVFPNMFKSLFGAIQSEHADMSLCNYIYVDDNGAEIEKTKGISPIRDEVITGDEALQKLSKPNYGFYVTAWNKLYKAELFLDERFPVGKIHEDEFVAHRLFGKCKKIACISEVGLAYVQRSGSIMHTKTSKMTLHLAESFLDRAKYCMQRGLADCAKDYYYKTARQITKLLDNADLNSAQRTELLFLYRSFRKDSLWRSLSFKKRIKLVLLHFCPRLHRVKKSIRNFITQNKHI